MTEERLSGRRFETEIEIGASAEVVWDAISTKSGLEGWFAPRAEVDLQLGGELVWAWGSHHVWKQRIEVLEPGKRLRTRYDSQVEDGEGGRVPLFVDFVLEGEGGSTTLRLVQSGFGAESGFDDEYDGISRGWPVELRSLRLYAERHAGKRREVAWADRQVDVSPAEAWERITGEDGFRCGARVEDLPEGAPFAFETVDGDLFRGTALKCQSQEFCGTDESHGGGFLRLSIEKMGGGTTVWCWLGAYDRSDEELRALQERWAAMLDRLFPATVAAAAGTEA